MIKCPFCHYENEDGALFCERCTSDLSSVASSPAKAAPPPPPPMMAAMPMAEAFPMEAEPMAVEIVEALPMAVAEPMEALPMAMAEPMAVAEPMMPALELVEAKPAPVPQTPVVHAPPPAPAVHVPPAASVPTPAPAVAAPAPAPAAPAGEAAPAPLPPNANPRLVVLRGQKRNAEYPICAGLNFIGRADDKPVDIDLEEQEPPDRIWCSRQHACIEYENDQLLIEDLNSANGTYVNRVRVYPGVKRPLGVNDVVQIGNVQMKVLA